MDSVTMIASQSKALAVRLDEATLRLWAAVEARQLGRGGLSLVAKAVGLSRTTISAGLAELDRTASITATPAGPKPRVRIQGGGRKKLVAKDPPLLSDLEALVDPGSRGDPMSPLRWTCKSTPRLAPELRAQGHAVSQRTVGDLLATLGYSLQSTRKTRAGGNPPDREAQFQHIAHHLTQYQAAGDPVISVDTKKKELIGDFKKGGQEWRPKGKPEAVRVYDFIDPNLGKVAPYGVYDLTTNPGGVRVGIDHDTAEFAVESIRRWWREMGQPLYPKATRRLITADCGGSNGYRVRLWRVQLQQLADELGLLIQVCHFPPGTSQWNKIEHRLFCHITQNWRGRPLLSREVVVNLLGNTTTAGGLKSHAELDENTYTPGIKVSDQELAELAIAREAFHGEWNDKISPRQSGKSL